MTDDTAARTGLVHMVSLKPIEDCTARVNMMTHMFSGSTQATQDLLDLKIQMTELEELLSKEMRLWWDLSTLKSYIDKTMIPRGLRLKKFPSIAYNDDFKQKWEQILSECSLNLIRLIITHEEETLLVIRTKITALQSDVKIHAETDTFNKLDNKMQENLNKLEKIITETKQTKFLRDLQDYKTNNVYLWNKRAYNTPRSILRRTWKRKERTPGKVNFSSTEADSSDTTSDFPDEQACTSAGPNNATKYNTKQQKKSQPAKNASGGANAEQVGNIQGNPRYPRRTKNK